MKVKISIEATLGDYFSCTLKYMGQGKRLMPILRRDKRNKNTCHRRMNVSTFCTCECIKLFILVCRDRKLSEMQTYTGMGTHAQKYALTQTKHKHPTSPRPPNHKHAHAEYFLLCPRGISRNSGTISPSGNQHW